MKLAAPLLGFFEVSIWLLAIGQVMQNLTDVRCSLAFAGGFTLGNLLGIVIEQQLALGSVVVRTITHKDGSSLVQELREAGYGVTSLSGQGATGPVQVIFTIVPRRLVPAVVVMLKHFDPTVFYTVDPLQQAAAGVVPIVKRRVFPLIGLFPSRDVERAA
jgi:uncharacterized protein YebE (UPF0316 family)